MDQESSVLGYLAGAPLRASTLGLPEKVNPDTETLDDAEAPADLDRAQAAARCSHNDRQFL